MREAPVPRNGAPPSLALVHSTALPAVAARKIPEVGDMLRVADHEWLVVRVAKGNNGSSITVTLRPLDE